ncbi:hypothetical protein OG936_31180 [Streptomyces sp. NBC_00846]|uniref:hypothetical protein n=1 Tax=Streptomyces sp. NBC_00846 TaxID=2975849 RepID=UPI00386ADC31|nr:hypothetical protein OG936_31180 [Streptomyces sp. NBC_00846]
MYVANNTDWNEGGYNNSQPCYVGKPFMPPVYGLEPGDADCCLHNANRGERHTLDALEVADGYTQKPGPAIFRPARPYSLCPTES